MEDKILQTDYDAAAAVFSRSFRFVEWKFVNMGNKVPYSFGDDKEPLHKAIKNIDRNKWIYVFRHGLGEPQYAEFQEEIFIDANGEMEATVEEEVEKEIPKRGKRAALGKTMCLPRRILGTPLRYRFFACRERLPLKQITELKSSIHTFAPATSLDPGPNTSIIEKDGELLVPVVDAITVLLHLHAAYVAAASDVIDYTVAHSATSKDNPREAVDRRRKKQLLASILDAIMDSDDSNTVVQKLKGMQGPLQDYLTHYEKAVQRRVDRRDRLAGLLANWHGSTAMRVTATAFEKSPKKKEWHRFLAPWCHSITRLEESPAGRKFLLELIDDKGHFVHQYVWPKSALSEDAPQAIRKAGMSVFEAWRVIAEMKVLLKPGVVATLAKEAADALQILLKSIKEETTVSLGKQAAMLHTINRAVNAGRAAPILLPSDVPQTERHFASSPRKLGAIVEAVNLVLAVKQTADTLSDENASRRDKELAILSLIGSGLDAGVGMAALIRDASSKTEILAGAAGFISGVIDIYLGVVAMDKAFNDGDQGLANGSFLTAVGATFSVSASVLAFLAVPGASVVAVLGLAIVAVGFIYKFFAGDSDMERFFEHCSWGLTPAQAGGADWSPTRFEQWKGAKEFDYQLEALLNLLCHIEIGHGKTFRHLRYKIGWIPPNSKLQVTYDEEWEGVGSARVTGEVTILEKSATTDNPALVASLDGQNTVKIQVLGTGKQGGLPARSPNNVSNDNPTSGLKRAATAGSLAVKFEGLSPVKIPHKGPKKEEFYDSWL